MNTAAPSTVEKRRSSPAVLHFRQAEKQRKALWRYRLQGWLRQLPAWILRKTSLSELVEAQVQARTEQLFRQAHFDALTHLPNRAYFMQTLEQALKQAEVANRPFALLYLDLDGFKPVNDTYGHGAGDELLRLVAARLASSVRDDDFVARLGGDEFIILLRDTVNREVIETISKRIIQEVSRPYWVNGHTVQISTSVGISEYPEDATTVSRLIERADQALYAAKRRGRKQFCFYREAQQLPDVAPDRLQSRFEVDVEQHRLALHFRPLMALQTRQCLGARLNVHWQGAPIDPAWYEDWRHLLQRSQWSISVGLWMIDAAAYYRSQWHHLPNDFYISVPLERALFLEEDLNALLIQRLSPYGISPQQLELRIDLDTLYKLDQKAIQNTRILHESGFRLRFTGLGACSLEPHLLSHAPIKAIALDGRWVQQQLDQPQGKRWVHALIALASGLQASVHVEDIQNGHQHQLLMSYGAHSGEGAYWQNYLTDKAFWAYLQHQLETHI